MKKTTTKKRYHGGELKASSRKEEKLLDHMWELFCHLEDSEDRGLVEAVCACVEEYNFDIGELPDGLVELVNEKFR